MKFFIKLLISACGAGFLFWPGFWGSWIGFAISWYVPDRSWVIFSVMTVLGYVLCRPAQKVTGVPDPQIFVLDEVCGMMLSVLALPHDIWVYVMAYVLFRVLDTLKPGPIRMLDRSHGRFSIMNDDMAAGLAVNLILRFLLLFCPHFSRGV